jgi:replicative DNA helicase
MSQAEPKPVDQVGCPEIGLVDRDEPLSLEEAVLGAALCDERLTKIGREQLKVKPTIFQSPRNREIWKLMAECDTESPGKADVFAVERLMKQKGLTERCNGRHELHRLMQGSVSGAHFEKHVGFLQEDAKERWITEKLYGIPIALASNAMALNEVPAKLTELSQILECSNPKPWLTMADAANNALLEEAETVIVPTPIPALNHLLGGGLKSGRLTILAARTAVGKSAFAENVIEHACQEGPVLLFSLEMDELALAERFHVRHSGDLGEKLARSSGAVRQKLAEELRPSIAKARVQDLFIVTDEAIDMETIRAKALSLKAEKGELRLVVIDYMGFVTPEKGGNPQSRQEQVAGVSRACKRLSKQLGCPVLVLSQLNRGVELREDKRPKLADLRESGAIEQDADVVLMLYRAPDSESGHFADGEIIISKNRTGKTGTVPARFNGPRGRWEPVDVTGYSKGPRLAQ